MKESLPPLHLPAVDAPVRIDSDSRRGGMEIFDGLRGRWVALTPEEWVRQHFVQFLISTRGFRRSIMANEVSLRLNGTARRADTLVYAPDLRPLCVVEYKAPEIKITQKVFDQIARYNSVIQAPYLIVSNGLSHYCCRYDSAGYHFLPDIPDYDRMLSSL